MKLPKLTRFTKISLASAAVMLVAWLGLTIFTENASTTTRVESGVVRENVCPHCGRAMPQSAIQNNECPYCVLENPGNRERAKIRKDSGGLASGRTIARILIGSVVLLLLANIGVLVYGRLKQKQDETVFHYNCPKCRRKLRYREGQIGRLAKCPLCERPIVFPRPADFVASRWKRFRRWIGELGKEPQRHTGTEKATPK